MTSKTFATFNPNAIGPDLALDLGNLVVTTDAVGVDGNRMVLITIPKAVGHVYVEFYHYSNSRGDLTDLVSIGIAETDCPLDEFVGGPSGKSWGLRPDYGSIWNGGTEIESGGAQPIPERTCIGLYVNFDGLSSAGPFIAWYSERTQVAATTLPSGKFWVAAVSVGTTDQGAGDVSVFGNFGQRVFENQPSESIT